MKENRALGIAIGAGFIYMLLIGYLGCGEGELPVVDIAPAAPPTDQTSSFKLHGVKGHDGVGAYVIVQELEVRGERIDISALNLRIGGRGLWDTIDRPASVRVDLSYMWEGEGPSLIGVGGVQLELYRHVED